jgi:pilus assembly protein CpaE
MPEQIRVLAIAEARSQDPFSKQIRGQSLLVLGEAGYGAEAVTATQETDPDVLLVNLDEPLARALRTIEVLSVTFPHKGIIAVAGPTDREATRKAVRAGARDYLTTPFGRDDVERAIVAVYEAEHKRRELSAPENIQAIAKGEIVVIFGAKGGIGKTTLAVNLAAAIQRETKARVALVDLDMQMGDVALMLNVTPERTIADAAANAERLEPDFVQSLVFNDASGVHVLSSVTRPEESADITSDQIGKVLDALVRTFDYVITDTSPTLNDVNIAAIERATVTLLLTSTELSSIKRTKLALDVLRNGLHYPEERMKLVINSQSPLKGVPTPEIEATLGIPIYFQIPFDSAVGDSVKIGRPTLETKVSSRYGQTIVQLARGICGIRTPKRRLFGLIGGR